MRLRLQNYDIQVEYKKGTTMFLADTLSRAYLEGEQSTVPNSDVRSIKERLFAFELEQIKHDEELTVSPFLSLFITLLQALAIPRVMVVLKMP